MGDRLKSTQDAYFELFREFLLPVYNYHLGRSGDWQIAQVLTRETFRKALFWFEIDAGKEKRAAWLFRIAVTIQGQQRRWESRAPESPAGIAPGQDQLAVFARAAEITLAWKKFSTREADAFALHLFAKLSLAETAEVVGWDDRTLSEKLTRRIGDADECRVLAGSIQMVGFYPAQLEADLRDQVSHAENDLWKRITLALWRISYWLKPALTAGGKVAPLLLMGFILVWGIRALSAQSMAGADPTPTPAPTPSPTSPVDGPFNFPYTGDSAFIADDIGRIYTYALTSGYVKDVTPPGFYLQGNKSKLIQPALSPDGRWLELVHSTTYFTWLFSLDGLPARIIDIKPTHFLWAPDSHSAVLYYLDNPRSLALFDLARLDSAPLVDVPGEIDAVAWSPDGKKIAVMYRQEDRTGEVVQSVQTTIATVDVSSKTIRILYSLNDILWSPNLSDRLLWTKDGKEIWFPRNRISIRVDDQTIHPLVSTPPYDLTGRPTTLNLLLHPVLAQPFFDRFGIEALLLNETDPQNFFMNIGAVSPDRTRIAVGYFNASGFIRNMAMLGGEAFTNQLWAREFDSIGKIAWTDEGESLVVSEYANQTGVVYYVLASQGKRIVIAKNGMLIGTESSLHREGQNLAPEMSLKMVKDSKGSSQEIQAIHTGLGIQVKVPSGWDVWTTAEGKPYGSMVITNFSLSGPTGFSSLGEDQLMIWISPVAWKDSTPLRDWLDRLVKASAGKASYTPVYIRGELGYHLQYIEPDQSIDNTYLFDTGHGTIGISMIPNSTRLVDAFERVVSTIEFIQVQSP